ncbi:hypothetical protein HYPSUDRAFT_618370 [Hypholoma sublateritium FD-334 SS-4]|uniref:Uncharacterized protein n=1 Tax=Hypholoma sublateritium (strain FD-334 SS-4) TaxID=945553 RepID=A0A0D2PK59_HYPSF|nr:hypothetical protein HYPSUDRAFT_618370 [Hypholoma sublateritium FD-334 SS-4]
MAQDAMAVRHAGHVSLTAIAKLPSIDKPTRVCRSASSSAVGRALRSGSTRAIYDTSRINAAGVCQISLFVLSMANSNATYTAMRSCGGALLHCANLGLGRLDADHGGRLHAARVSDAELGAVPMEVPGVHPGGVLHSGESPGGAAHALASERYLEMELLFINFERVHRAYGCLLGWRAT